MHCEYIRKFIINILISQAQKENQAFASIGNLHNTVLNIPEKFCGYRRAQSWGVSLGMSNSAHGMSKKASLSFILWDKRSKSHLNNTFLPWLFKYVQWQHPMPLVLPCSPCCLFPIQPMIIGIHEAARTSCKFPHHLQRNTIQWTESIGLKVFFTWGGGGKSCRHFLPDLGLPKFGSELIQEPWTD